MDMSRKKISEMSDDELRQIPVFKGGDQTPEEKAAAEAKAQADAEAAAAAARDKDAEYWKAEAKKAFEARDRAKDEARLLQERNSAPAPAPEPPVNLDQQFWEKPSEVLRQVVGEYIAPMIDDRYEQQKAQFRKDPEFVKYESKIDQIVKLQPALKQKPSVVSDLYRVVRAMEFDPEAERERIRQEELAKLTGRQAASVEGAGAAPPTAPIPTVELSDEEKRVARGLFRGVQPVEAYRKYAEAKTKYAQRGL